MARPQTFLETTRKLWTAAQPRVGEPTCSTTMKKLLRFRREFWFSKCNFSSPRARIFIDSFGRIPDWLAPSATWKKWLTLKISTFRCAVRFLEIGGKCILKMLWRGQPDGGFISIFSDNVHKCLNIYIQHYSREGPVEHRRLQLLKNKIKELQCASVNLLFITNLRKLTVIEKKNKENIYKENLVNLHES